MKLKKLIAQTVVIALAATALAGCGGEKETVSQKKTITIWTNGRSTASARQEMVQEFNESNKDNITIDLQMKSDDFVDALKAAYQSNAAPDIHPGHAKLDSGAMENGWYRELDEKTKEKYRDLLLIPLFVGLGINDKKYSIRTGGVTSHRMIYNKDLFKKSGLDPEKPPKTWDEVIEYAKIITEKGGGKQYGFALPLKTNGFVHYYVINPAIPSGATLLNGYDPVTGEYKFEQYGKMIDVLKKMQKNGSLFPSPSTIDNDSARAQFSEGNIGMMMAYFWDVAVFSEQFPTKCDWECVDIPTFTGEITGGNPGSIGSGEYYIMSNTSKYKDAQLKVWDWYVGEECAKKLQEQGLSTYQFKSLIGADKIKTDKKGAAELYSISEPAFFLEGIPDTPNPTNMLKIEGDSFADTIAGIIKGELDTDSTLKDLSKRYNKALGDYIKTENPDEKTIRDKDWSGIVNVDEIIKK